ncbi:hypothetical protein [Pyrinomonas sp.]|uniref:hypothetical protein n=1 Tax=Pyrinomonas sp. TaxID=2080306 RepID=UPI00331A9EB6
MMTARIETLPNAVDSDPSASAERRERLCSKFSVREERRLADPAQKNRRFH